MIDVEVRMTGSGAWTAAVAAVALQVISSHPSVPPKKLPSLLVAASSWASRFAKCLTLQRHLDPTWPFRPMAKTPFVKNSPNKNAENLRKMSKVPAFHLSSYMKIHFVPASGETSPIKWTCGGRDAVRFTNLGHHGSQVHTYSHLQPLASCLFLSWSSSNILQTILFLHKPRVELSILHQVTCSNSRPV